MRSSSRPAGWHRLHAAYATAEGPRNGFTSIPVAMYWAVTTMTTVGFGDITPHTDVGKLIASAMMLLGLQHTQAP